MSGQGVRTHHRRAVERGLQQGLLTLVNDPDNISGQDMLSFGCDDYECRVLLPKGAGQHGGACLLGESRWSCARQQCALRVSRGGGPYTLYTQTVPLATRGYLTPGILPRSGMSGSSDSAYPESIHDRQFRFPGQPFLHSAVEFLLKFPDICDTLEAEHRKLKANFATLRDQPFAAK